MKKGLIVLLFVPFICFSQKAKDTLFIKLDGKYLKKGYDYNENKNIFIFKDNDKKEDLTYLSIIDTVYNLNPIKKYCMKEILKQSGAYYGNGNIRDYDLAVYLNKYTLFISEKKYFIKTVAINEIE